MNMDGKIQKQMTQQTEKKQSGLQPYITKMLPAIKAALPSVITPERFSRIVTTAISSNPKLGQCTPNSFLGAMMQAAQLGVEPNTPLGQAYLIPYMNHGKLECQFQLGYKGLIDLAYRSGEISTIQAQIVYENDEFEYSFGLEPTLKHIPARGDRGASTHVYAVYRKKDGGYGYEAMSMDEVRKHASKYSKSYGNGPWKTNFEEMAKKTVLKRLLKLAPLRSDFQRSLSADESIKTEILPDMYEAEDVTEYEVVEDAQQDTGTVTVDGSTGEIIDGQQAL
ncbi:MAG: recombinase RecT [Bacteroidales bacterium]|nr:recombinase RecT [Bacteroidales bacterium]